MIVIDTTAWRLYELFDAHPLNGGTSWHAGSGATWDLSSNALRPAGWTSADAAGLPDLPRSRALRRGGREGRDHARAALHVPDDAEGVHRTGASLGELADERELHADGRARAAQGERGHLDVSAGGAA